ncbi:5-oxoprolinase subunit PxpA [Clostridium butyricum]|uniref:5-oxoprolinase subunit PxpA n=1 Tax=Clostridium TaxID=1485 RepID=UPI00071B0C77|nr:MULTISPECIES: 5-oxoprolinase subunit PxpA [Clostridium]ALP89682.1 lactam utilization protein LamB [Clostridium butyricum]ALS16137.1 lactam utilization protein LamB [Clostridium butyricum]ANF13295.1 lactam utilization protein LamB [Clostridium butyricum]AOR93365.1 lactam utilization protein LamB [Clostridium butyricum]MCI3007479.1 5-oxoprolinase subunit PxpA [Clostridium butyricum]
MYRVDLNCDLGESFGNYKIGCDDEIIPYISSANIACGFHASDPLVMDKTVKLAKEYEVSVGAHPGLSDLAGFGRRNMNVSCLEVKTMVQYQIGALNAFCIAHKVQMKHVKPHGALYNMAGNNLDLALAICDGIKSISSDLILLGLSGSKLLEAAKIIGLRSASEVFADRAYNDDGSLVSRNIEGAVIVDENEAINRVVRMIKERKVETINGIDIPINAESICVHGDGVRSLEFVKKINNVFKNENIEITELSNIV